MGSDINKSHSYLALLLPEKMRVTLFPVIAMLVFSVVNAGDCDKVFKGLYTWGAEVNVFQPCGSGDIFWVSASSWVQGPLLEYVQKSMTKPYQSIYMEVRGSILDEVRGGFAQQYDGLIRVSEITYRSSDIPVQCSKW